ncbi:MAG: FkbM family methyltransferase [Pirellulales bacterium]|nr:FkbM family methyltransferase [Pirellulales bacterium]
MSEFRHPVFESFVTTRQSDPSGMHTDFVGARTSQEFGGSAPSGYVESMPPVDEDYLEWIDILETAAYARDRFVMVELGAGYGRWGVRGALAARHAGIKDIFIGFAEAEPMHVKWLKEHATCNGLQPHEFRLYEAAVSDKDGSVDFYVAMPDGSEGNDPASWYGQAMAKDYEVVSETIAHGAPSKSQNSDSGKAGLDAQSTETYAGHNVKTFASGWKAVEVPQMAATKLLRDFDVIDLLDMDVQGEEVKIVQGAIKDLNKRVKRLHIGTHSREIEFELYQFLTAKGWKCLRAYPCESRTSTPYGDVQFVDGMQSWINPQLVPVEDFAVESIHEPGSLQSKAANASLVMRGKMTRLASKVKRIFGRKAA